eukprot:43422-Eustigmatos_ZCMA.PRE.1
MSQESPSVHTNLRSSIDKKQNGQLQHTNELLSTWNQKVFFGPCEGTGDFKTSGMHNEQMAYRAWMGQTMFPDRKRMSGHYANISSENAPW